MLRIANEDVRPLHRGELRVLIAAARPAGLGQVRAYLSADLLRRYAERSGLAPSVIDFSPAGPDILRGVCDALNIHPPRHTLTSPFTPEQLDGLFPGGLREPVFDVGVRLAGETAGGTLAARWIDVPPEPRQAGLGEEPLSVRMNLMGFEGDAAETLRRWRKRVATWAESPSGAMSRAHADAIAAAFDDGLDTAAALRALAELDADESVADGVKFETFAAADRLFGLDLARDIGK